MNKNLKNMKWKSVALEGFPASITENLQGFVGLEECKNYGFEKDPKKPKKQKALKKRESTSTLEKEVSNKKVKLSNGFIVEACNSTTPSLANEISKENISKIDEKNQIKVSKTTGNSKTMEKCKNGKNKRKLGEDITGTESGLTSEDMLTWAEFKLPEPILKALTELGFKQPTKIQQLTLPAAIHGRRDILGAAETGSGKTLAFGLPILTGIMKFKEKADAGLDVYEIPYRKPSAKKKQDSEPVEKPVKMKNKKMEVPKESSEDEHSSGEEGDNEETITKEEENSDEEYVEEIVVPVRKREAPTDEANDSDDSDNYIHLSDMLDSDDMADSSDADINDSTVNGKENSTDANETGDETSDEEKKSGDESNQANSDEETKSGVESGDDNEDLVDEKQGIGCVKVIDDVEMPGQLVTKTGKPLYALILTPTRELAIQISNHLKAAAKYTGIRIATIVGGMAAAKQERVLRCGPEVVIATPGRLWELLTQGQPHLQQLHCVKFLAIDETDRMVERNHFEELHSLLERLNADEERRGGRQNFVFSATLTMVHDLPQHMKGKKVTKRGKIINRKVNKMTAQQKIKGLVDLIGMTEPKVVDITQTNLGTADTLTESRIACPLEHKEAYLYYILKRHPGRTIVFCNAINTVKRLTQTFTILNSRPLPLHASMPQKQRLKNLERFRDDPLGVLVATDVAARGLDIPDVDHVIHYQVPRTAENYVHRSGRTARANKEGLCILMMEPSEAYLYSKLCRTLNRTSEVPLFPVAPQALHSVRELVSLARDVEVLELRRRRAAQANGWRERAAREMDMIVDEDDLPTKEVDPALEKALRDKRRALRTLMSRPIIPKGFSYKYPTLNEPNALQWTDENALQVMKKAIQSGELKKEKRKSKNAPLLRLQKTLKKK